MIQPRSTVDMSGSAFREAASSEATFFSETFRHRGRARLAGWPAREQIRLGTDEDAVVSVTATSRQRLLEAAELVRARYEWRGYVTRSIRTDALDAKRGATTLVALQQDRVVGTMTLGFDGPYGLWIDQTYPEEMRNARAEGKALVELTRLAVVSSADSRDILSSLFALAYRVGRQTRGATDLFIEVNPRHVSLYRKLFGFTTASDIRVCGRVKAPAVLLRLDIGSLDEKVAGFLGNQVAADPALRAVIVDGVSPISDTLSPD
ncbi:MAG: hypothetical protein WCJ69_14215 [Betaproteobacteria bacterium]